MNDSNARLEQRYRRLLRAYPRSYRDRHGDDMLGVLMHDADEGKSRPKLAATLDLVRGAFLVHTRYWWEMRAATDHQRLAVRHPLIVIRVRLAVAVWLCVVTGFLVVRGYWWGAVVVAFFIVVHLVLAGRTAVRCRQR